MMLLSLLLLPMMIMTFECARHQGLSVDPSHRVADATARKRASQQSTWPGRVEEARRGRARP
jgi:hypothetical protein